MPQSPQLNHPADRRRVVYWADKRGHTITQDLTKKVDVYLLSGVADFSQVESLQVKAPVVIDLIDGYLLPQNPFIDQLRGLGKTFVARRIGPPKKYTRILSDALFKADVVLCASIEQKAYIEVFNKNCYAILDFHEEFPLRSFDSRPIKKNKLFWEGQPYTISGLNFLEKPIRELGRENDFELSLVTDLQTHRFLGTFGNVETRNRLGNIPEILGHKLKLLPWSIQNVIDETYGAALSTLPLDPRNFLNPLKPENRLLIMWRLGVPCLTSPNLAYERVMKISGNKNMCDGESEWLQQMDMILENPDIQRSIVENGQNYIMEFHRLADTLQKWDEVFETIVK